MNFALISKAQPLGQPENPDIFNNKIIKVKVSNKEDPGINATIDVKINVQNRWGNVLGAHAFSTIPVPVDLNAKKIRMVLVGTTGSTMRTGMCLMQSMPRTMTKYPRSTPASTAGETMKDILK